MGTVIHKHRNSPAFLSRPSTQWQFAAARFMTYDDDEWDDDDYDDFIAREFPDQASSSSSGRRHDRGGIAPHWRWTAWGILVLLAIFGILSLA